MLIGQAQSYNVTSSGMGSRAADNTVGQAGTVGAVFSGRSRSSVCVAYTAVVVVWPVLANPLLGLAWATWLDSTQLAVL